MLPLAVAGSGSAASAAAGGDRQRGARSTVATLRGGPQVLFPLLAVTKSFKSRETLPCEARPTRHAWLHPSINRMFGDGPVARLSDEQWRGTGLLYLGLCKRLSGVARPLRRKTTRYTRTHRVVVNSDTRVHKQLCAYMRHVPRITGLISEEQC